MLLKSFALLGLAAVVQGGSTVVDAQCSKPYLNISDVWRSVLRDCGGGGCPAPGCSPPDGPPVNCSCECTSITL
jgi:hypothetical protein